MIDERTPNATFAVLLVAFVASTLVVIATRIDPLLLIPGAILILAGRLVSSDWRGAAERFAHWRDTRWHRLTGMGVRMPEPLCTVLQASALVVIGCAWVGFALARLVG
jgi:hypothetical protein